VAQRRAGLNASALFNRQSNKGNYMHSTGKRLLVDAAGKVYIEEFEPPTPGPGQILVRVTTTQVSAGSEMNVVRRRRQAAAEERADFAAQSIGYTALGRVAAIGAGISDFAIGDRVLCSGNHSTHWLVTPADALSPVGIPQQFSIEKIEEQLSDVEAAFSVLGDIALHGVRLAQLQIGESVAVHGLGVIGQLSVQLCRLSGAHPIIGVDPFPERLQQAAALGASHLLAADADNLVEQIQAITRHAWRWRGSLPGMEPGIGADVQLHCTSVISNYPTLIKAAADRGRIILVGATAGSVPLESNELFRRELTLRGSYQTGMTDPHPYWPWSRARNRQIIRDLILRQQLAVQPLVSHVVPYTDAPALYDLMMNGGAGWMGVFFTWE
jgi:threonine dehydrogenase-like Zn-dependent dehydrogenase